MNIQGALLPGVITILMVILSLLELRSNEPDYRKLFVMVGITAIAGYATFWVLFQ